MTRTFLVPLEVGTDMDFLTISAELEELISGSGMFQVADPGVHFWNGQGQSQAPTLIQPPQQQNIIPPLQ